MAALEQELSEIFRRARRTGTARGRRSGRRLPIFSAVRGGKRYRIFTTPSFADQHAVVSITPDPVVSAPAPAEPPPAAEPPPDEPPPEEPPPADAGEELFEFATPVDRQSAAKKRYPSNVTADRRYRGTITLTWQWKQPIAISAVLAKDVPPRHDYVYILETAGGTPFYVGKIQKNENPYRRLSEYRRFSRFLEHLVREGCVTAAGACVPVAGALRIRVARVGATAPDIQKFAAKAAEDALVGVFLRGGVPLANDTLTGVPMMAEGGDLVIENVLPISYKGSFVGLVNNTLKVPDKQYYEYEGG